MAGTAYEAIQKALSYYGTSYKVGGSSYSLVDCSGLTLRAFEAIGIKLPHKAALQAEMGQRVNGLQNAQPGDLVFFSGGPTSKGTKNGVGHVAIYLGNGLLMEARGRAYKAGVYQLGNRASKIYSIQRFAAPSSQPIYIPQVNYTVPAYAGPGRSQSPGRSGGFGEGVAFPAQGSMMTGGETGGIGPGGPVSGDVVASAAYAAGFRGDDLTTMVAIAKGESGWNTSAYNGKNKDNSYGLWQINMIGSMGPARRQAFGISSNEELFDPYVNARAAMQIFKSQGWKAWTVHSRGLYKKHLPAAQQAVQAAAASGYKYQPGGGTGTFNPQYAAGPDTGMPPNDRPDTLNPSSSAEAVAAGAVGAFNAAQSVMGGAFDAPGGGTVYTVAETGESYVVYNIGSAKTAFHLTPEIGTTGLSQGGTISQSQWDQMSIVMGGEGAELSMMAGQDFNVWLESVLIQLFGQNNPARNDPGVQAVIAELIGRPDMDPVELQNRLKATDYYQSMTQAQMAWNDLPDAEKQKQRNDQAQRMIDTIFAETGLVVDQNDPMVQAWLDDLASGKVGYGAFTAEVRRRALENPESPWSQTIREEEESQRQRPFDIENMTLNVKKLFQQWGVPVTAGTATQWARDIVEMRQSEDDLLNTVKQQAGVMYATKPPDMDTTTWASPWMETYSRLMEKSADLTDKDVQRALTNGTPVYEFEKELMARPEWMGTKNGVNSMANAISGLGKLMGF